MSKASEETTKGLTADVLKDIIDYPSNQNIKVDGITWFKEDSYKGTDYDWLSAILKRRVKSKIWKTRVLPILLLLKIILILL